MYPKNKKGGGEKPLYLMYYQIYAMLTFGDSEHFNPCFLYPEIKGLHQLYWWNFLNVSQQLELRNRMEFWSNKVMDDRMKAAINTLDLGTKPEQQAVAIFRKYTSCK